MQVGSPGLPVIQQVDVHEFVDHFNGAAMNITQLSVLSDQSDSLGLDLLIVLLDLNWVVPGDHTSVGATGVALRVLDQVLELCRLVNHHGLLAVDHLSAHRVEEVGGLLERQTFLVELLSVLCDGVDSLGDLEAMLTENTSILDQSDELGRVINFEETTSLKIELHELAAHF